MERFSVLAEVDVEALEPILLLPLKGIELPADDFELDLDLLAGLIFQIRDLGPEHGEIDRLLILAARGPVVLAQAVGQQALFLLEVRKIFPLAIGNGGEFPHQ